MGIYYLGQFPPPYGGVTVKNSLLYNALAEQIKIIKVGFRDENTLRIMQRLFTSKNDIFLFGFGNAGLQKKLLLLLFLMKPSLLSRCYLIVMGVVFSRDVAENRAYLKACSNLRGVYVETRSMADELIALGLTNIVVYPNCRKRPVTPVSIKNQETELNKFSRLECVFFSYVSPEKGADYVIEAARRLPRVGFTIYGRIDERFADDFYDATKSLDNVVYKGVFDSVKNDVVTELSMYDLHLFPTRWPTEGVPGVLVETKMAAVPSIVSDVCYNSELVLDGREGIVLEGCTVEALCAAIEKLNADRDLLWFMKEKTLDSAERFYIDRYIDWLVADLQEATERTYA